MAKLLFIHGSCHGAWCWRDVLPHLSRHWVSALDLPGHGRDKTPVGDITLEDYITAILAEITRMGAPVILVGHSAAGVILAAVAERAPDKVSQLVFVCAYAPQTGDSVISMRKRAKRQLVVPAVQLAPDRLSYSFKPDIAPSVFYHDCSAEHVAYALARLCAEPVLPQATPVELGANYETVPRNYILCADDHAIPPEEQETMVRDWPEPDVTRLPCGHSPFFTHPAQLAEILDTITTRTS